MDSSPLGPAYDTLKAIADENGLALLPVPGDTDMVKAALQAIEANANDIGWDCPGTYFFMHDAPNDAGLIVHRSNALSNTLGPNTPERLPLLVEILSDPVKGSEGLELLGETLCRGFRGIIMINEAYSAMGPRLGDADETLSLLMDRNAAHEFIHSSPERVEIRFGYAMTTDDRVLYICRQRGSNEPPRCEEMLHINGEGPMMVGSIPEHLYKLMRLVERAAPSGLGSCI
jgi:hypothetical protein